MKNFSLHPNLERKIFIAHLELSTVLLEDNSYYPWLFLVPRREGVCRLTDLGIDDQIQLLKELDCAQKIIERHFDVTQLNVAAIGNKTPQLHVHVIGRFSSDPAWPGVVWDHPESVPYAPEKKVEMIALLQDGFKRLG